jgi:hypothetical protein
MVKNRLKARMFDAVQQATEFARMGDNGLLTLKAQTPHHPCSNGCWRLLRNDTVQSLPKSICRGSGTAGLPLKTGYR